MSKKSAKLWAHSETIKKTIVEGYIIVFIATLIVSPCISALVHSEEIDAGLHNAVRDAVLIGLQWFAIIMAVITVLCTVWFLCYSDRVVITDTGIEYYRWLFAKKKKHIPADIITECVLCARLWNDKRERRRGNKILLFHKATTIMIFDISDKLALALVKLLGEYKFKIVDDKGGMTRISHYYKIDFMNLSSEQQLAILEYYYKFDLKKYYKTGEEILKKKKLL